MSAQGYVELAPIPGTTAVGDTGTQILGTYLTGIFKVGIAVAGVLAFLMIVIGGFQYLSTDAITGKEEGKQRIARALGGLILALASYIILYTINPNLVSLNLNFGGTLKQGVDLSAPSNVLAINNQLTDQQLAALKASTATRDKTMAQDVQNLNNSADTLTAQANTLPDGASKTDLLNQAAGLRKQAAEKDLQRVVVGNQGLATANTLNAYTQDQLSAAITDAGTELGAIDAAYIKARTDFASDPARVEALSTEQMGYKSSIDKSIAFGLINNPPTQSVKNPTTGVTSSYVDSSALSPLIQAQITAITTEATRQTNNLYDLNHANASLVPSEVASRIAQINVTANNQICQIKNLCSQKGYSCSSLSPSITCAQ